jgi:hypothetical protein
MTASSKRLTLGWRYAGSRMQCGIAPGPDEPLKVLLSDSPETAASELSGPKRSGLDPMNNRMPGDSGDPLNVFDG